MAGIFITGALASTVVVTIIFMPTYLHTFLHFHDVYISKIMLLIMLANVLTTYLCGVLAQKISPNKIFHTVLYAGLIMVILSYYLIGAGHWLGFSLIILGVLEGASAMLVPLILTYLFPVEVRLTGVALCYNISFTLFGGMAPIIITYLIKNHANLYATPAIYLFVILLVSLLGITLANKYSYNKIE